jgi:hypothetical protein
VVGYKFNTRQGVSQLPKTWPSVCSLVKWGFYPFQVFGGSMIRCLLFGAMLLSSSFAHADEDWMPQARHAFVAEQGRDCAIYRSIAAKSRLGLEQAQDAELHFTEILKVRRAELKACAEAHGIVLTQSEDREQLAAEVCPQQYNEWIRTGYRLRANLQDREGARHSLEVIQANLDRFCADSGRVAPASIRIQ